MESILHVTGRGQHMSSPPAGLPEAQMGMPDFAAHLEGVVLGPEDSSAPSQPVLGVPWSSAPYVAHTIDSFSRMQLLDGRTLSDQMRMYVEDQLLAHPGGDSFDLDAPDPRGSASSEVSFPERIRKDLGDALANAVNFVRDLFGGSSYKYVDECDQVRTAHRTGVLGTVVEFFKDLVSGLSLGYFRPEGEPEPQGILERLAFAGKKILGEAILDDLVYGVPSTAIHLVDDAALAAWNLLEVVPDATIGNLPGGQEVITRIFDNGQVAIDYITDCLPGGEAWMRVHGYRVDGEGFVPPILYNLKLPERHGEDSRWATVRNTPFRKTMETVGSLLADLALARFTTHGPRTSKRRQ